MQPDEYKSDETKQLEKIESTVQDLVFLVERIQEEMLSSTRSTLIASSENISGIRNISWLQVLLLALILWRVW